MKLLFLTPNAMKALPPKAKRLAESLNKLEDKAKSFKEIYDRAMGSESLMKDHTPGVLKSRKRFKSMLETIRNDIQPYAGAAAKSAASWILLSMAHRITSGTTGISSDSPEIEKIKIYESPPELIYKNEDGVKYRTKFEIDHGRPNKYVRSANDLFGKDTRWLLVPEGATSAEYYNRIYAQTGANRQGWATWGLFGQNVTDTEIDSWSSWKVYNYFGLPSMGMLANEFVRTGMTTDFYENTLDITNSNATKFKNDYMVDLRTTINSRFSVHSFFNSNKYSDANIKVYVCQSKLRQSKTPIWFDICGWGNNNITGNGLVPQKGKVVTATKHAPGAGVNWFNSSQDSVRWQTNQTGISNVYVETSSVLGMTPAQSQEFRNNWEVLDVLDCTIGPNDTWDLHLDEKFDKSFSVRQWMTDFGRVMRGDNGNYDEFLKYHSKGDVVLLTVFSGSPSPTYTLSSGGEYETVMPVDAAPCRIRHEVRHGINVSWPESIVPYEEYESDGTSGPTNYVNDKGWISVKERTNYTQRETHAYHDGSIYVMSPDEVRTGGSKTSAGT